MPEYLTTVEQLRTAASRRRWHTTAALTGLAFISVAALAVVGHVIAWVAR